MTDTVVLFRAQAAGAATPAVASWTSDEWHALTHADEFIAGATEVLTQRVAVDEAVLDARADLAAALAQVGLEVEDYPHVEPFDLVRDLVAVFRAFGYRWVAFSYTRDGRATDEWVTV